MTCDRPWEYYQFLQNKYQVAIETLRLDVFTFLSQDNLNISKFLDRHCARAKKTGLKGGLAPLRYSLLFDCSFEKRCPINIHLQRKCVDVLYDMFTGHL